MAGDTGEKIRHGTKKKTSAKRGGKRWEVAKKEGYKGGLSSLWPERSAIQSSSALSGASEVEIHGGSRPAAAE